MPIPCMLIWPPVVGLLDSNSSAVVKATTKAPVPFVVVGHELDIAMLVERHFNKCPYRISSGLAGLVVLGMPSLDDAKSSTLSLIPSFV